MRLAIVTMMMRLLVCFCALFHIVSGTGQLWIRLISYRNPGGEGSNGHPCDGKFLVRGSECDHRFVICVDDSYELQKATRCAYGSQDTGEIRDQDNINFGSTVGWIQNPLVFRFKKWPGSVAIKIKVTDVDDNSDDDVDFMSKVFTGKVAISESASNYTDFDLSARTSMKMKIKLFCNQHFYGNDCSTFCIPRNNDVSGHFRCDSLTGDKVCLGGWTGPDCRTAVDQCQENPCQNGGTCRREKGKSTCVCSMGYSGQNCSYFVDPCKDTPCLHGGTCISQNGSFQCLCKKEFFGVTCSEISEECLNNKCLHNGTCSKKNGVEVCACAAGWTGKVCENDINECFGDNLCKNEATCINLPGNYVCRCSKSFTGKFCENIRDCDQCFGNATCIRGGTNFNVRCICPEGYSGVLCDKGEATNCLVSPCQNNGTCVERGDQYMCQCASGFTGEYCETLTDGCVGDICVDHDDHCKNHNGTSSFLRKRALEEGFEAKFLIVLKEYIILEASTINVRFTQRTLDHPRNGPKINVTFEVFINGTKVCPDNIDILIKSLDDHDLQYLGILDVDTLPVFSSGHFHWTFERWRIAVITVSLLVIIVGSTFAVVFVCKYRSKQRKASRQSSSSSSAVFENQTYLEIQPLNNGNQV